MCTISSSQLVTIERINDQGLLMFTAKATKSRISRGNIGIA